MKGATLLGHWLLKNLQVLILILNATICFILPSGHVFDAPKIYVHLATIVVLMYLYLFKKTKFTFQWKPMLVFGVLLGIFYFLLNN